jgi:hypothetical protein
VKITVSHNRSGAEAGENGGSPREVSERTGFGRSTPLTHSAFPALLCAVLAVFAVLAGVTGVGPCAGRCKKVLSSRECEERKYQRQKEDRERSRLSHRAFSSVAARRRILGY